MAPKFIFEVFMEFSSPNRMNQHHVPKMGKESSPNQQRNFKQFENLLRDLRPDHQVPKADLNPGVLLQQIKALKILFYIS